MKTEKEIFGMLENCQLGYLCDELELHRETDKAECCRNAIYELKKVWDASPIDFNNDISELLDIVVLLENLEEIYLKK